MGERDSLTTLLLMSLVALPLVLFTIVFGEAIKKNVDKALFAGVALLVLGAIVKSIAWAYQETRRTIRHDAELAIMEVLSHGESWSRKELRKELRKTNWALWLYGDAVTLALSVLLANGKVHLSEGEYSLKRRQEDSSGVELFSKETSAEPPPETAG